MAHSTYKFVDPIRYFKANDPYYFEVDNIPLKQLQENILWVKEHMGTGGGGGGGNLTTVKRENFDELRPFVDSIQNNRIRVRPGRFMARVNDAYDISPGPDATNVRKSGEAFSVLGMKSTVGKKGIGPPTKADWFDWSPGSESSTIQNILQKFKASASSGNATFMTGLVERTFTYPVLNAYLNANDLIKTTTKGPQILAAMNQIPLRPPYPLSQAVLWSAGRSDEAEFELMQFNRDKSDLGFTYLAMMESAFIKRWKGIFRTSVVDVPEELWLDIPAFDEDDYFYKDSEGVKRKINLGSGNADVRIDLLFIYAKTIDVSSTHIGKYSSGVPSKITKAEIGMVRGAGLGIDWSKGQIEAPAPEDATDDDGNLMILPNISDQVNTDAGFKGLNVHGSFPSPDDLMNQAPVLAEDVESNSLLLVGQSILPLAYIVSRKNSQYIAEADVIDIRPFFRTAELAYNERAGVAGASPQLSLANPAVGEGLMYHEMERLTADYTAKIRQVPKPWANATSTLMTGYIFGGTHWGPESAIGHANSMSHQTQFNDGRLAQLLGLTDTDSIPVYPNWDVAEWCSRNHATNPKNMHCPGLYPNDYINVVDDEGWYSVEAAYGNPETSCETRGPYGFGSGSKGSNRKSKSSCDPLAAGGAWLGDQRNLKCLGTDAGNISQSYSKDWRCRKSAGGNSFADLTYGDATIYYVSRSIEMKDFPLDDFDDYLVRAELFNCIPMTSRAYDSNTQGAAGMAGIWITKNATEGKGRQSQFPNFQIHVAWTARDSKSSGEDTRGLDHSKHPYHNRDEGSLYAGFAVIHPSTNDDQQSMWSKSWSSNLSGHKYPHEQKMGYSILPSVSFEVIGINNQFLSHYGNGVGSKITDSGWGEQTYGPLSVNQWVQS